MGKFGAYILGGCAAAVSATLFMSTSALAQTTKPYKPLSDPYANVEVRSATTVAPDDPLNPDAAAKADQRDPGNYGADGKAAMPQEPLFCEAPADQE